MLVERLTPHLQKKTTLMRRPIQVEEKIAVTLRFLATGETFSSLGFLFRIHRTTISAFVPRVCWCIFVLFREEYCSIPKTAEEWTKLSNETYNRWQFPNALAAIDGKHIALNCPDESGSEFHNYKTFFSVVFLALVTHDYRFLAYDVGCQGRISDGGVWANSHFFKKLKRGELNIPEPRELPQSSDPAWQPFSDEGTVPFVIVGDSAFPLTEHMMKPFPEKDARADDTHRIFNYRLSRFRRISENAFGIWANRFRIFHTTIDLNPDKVCLLVQASVVLHNMLCTKSRDTYLPVGYADSVNADGSINDGEWRNDNSTSTLRPLRPQSVGNNRKKTANEIRETLARYFVGPGAVEWQWNNLIS